MTLICGHIISCFLLDRVLPCFALCLDALFYVLYSVQICCSFLPCKCLARIARDSSVNKAALYIFFNQM